MDEYKDIKELLKPRRDIKASGSLNARISETINGRDRRPAAKGWLWGSVSLSAVAAMLILLLLPEGMSAKEILTAAITAIRNSTNIEMKVDIRTAPNDNFELIDPNLGFITHDICIISSDSISFWSIDKGGRAAEKNASGAYMWLDKFNIGWHSPNSDIGSKGYFSVLMNPEKILESELQLALSGNVKDFNMKKKDGNIYLTVHSLPEGDFANPYMLNKSIAESENIRRYVIDAVNYRLKSASIAMIKGAKEIEVLKITEIKYDSDNARLLPIPSGINFIEINGEYGSDGIEGLDETETASALFNAFTTWDTEILDKIADPGLSGWMYRRSYEGSKLLKLGTPFKSGKNDRITFVPYTIRLQNGYVKSMNLALRKTPQGRWIVSGGL